MTEIKVKPFHLLITRATVVLRHGTDHISLYTDLPTPFPPELQYGNLCLTFEATYGTGVEYVRKNFSVEPEIIDTRHVPSL